MLRVQVLVLDIIRQLRPVLTVLRSKDRSLEDQLRRAIASVALNLAEGVASRDGNKSFGIKRPWVLSTRVERRSM